MRIIFMGTGEIGLPSLRSLLERPDCVVAAVVTQPDKPAGRGRQLRSSAIKTLAESVGIPVLQPRKLRDPAAVAELDRIGADVIVVMAYGQILSRAVLEMPRLACLNLHASLLPRHRGAAPIQAAISSGDLETGITVMYMAEGLDTGDILLARPLAIQPDETGGTLHDRLAELAPEALAAALDKLAAGTAPRTPQSESLATYAGRLDREDGRIDWSRPAAEIDRHIRAMNPWPAASAMLPLAGGEMVRLKIHSGEIVPRESSVGVGTILEAGRNGILVSSGQDSVRLLEVQGEGARRMAAAAWLHGHALAIGGHCR